jgi:DNA polymerase-3 subunit alpha
MGFAAYFLIVWDFVKFAKDSGLAVGPGRGSRQGSIVSYALRITDVDPLEYDLLFERFLNAERISMPDIDIDFSVKGRDRVIQYVADKYGRESVAQIVTFGRMFPRAATRDAARVLGHDYGSGDRIAKLIPSRSWAGRRASTSTSPTSRTSAACTTRARGAADHRRRRGLEGIVRNSSIHAAAVVIADRPLTDIVPLQMADDRIVTQYSMKPIEEIGLLKMDFLGLRNLDVIEAALDIIEESTGARPDMTALPLDDAKTYEMLQRGDSIGVFQFESDGMREALKKVRPTEFEDVAALNALYRPGAMRHIDTYARNKRNPDAIQYIDERLRAITESSYGVILYQEQSMRIAKEIAGFSGPEADDLRKAIGKKQRDRMAALKDRFVEGARATGTSESVINELWSVNEAAADYSFNKSHACVLRPDLVPHRLAQGQLPGRVHGRADLLGHVHEGQGAVLRRAVRGHGHRGAAAGREPVGHDFKVVEGNIRFGLDAGEGARLPGGRGDHHGARGGRSVRVCVGLLPRVDCQAVNKKASESLVKCGAFDSLPARAPG